MSINKYRSNNIIRTTSPTPNKIVDSVKHHHMDAKYLRERVVTTLTQMIKFSITNNRATWHEALPDVLKCPLCNMTHKVFLLKIVVVNGDLTFTLEGM